MNRTKKSIENLSGTTRRAGAEIAATSGKAARDLASVGDGADAASKKAERSARNLQQHLERYLAQLQAGSRDSRVYWEQMAKFRGVDPAALKPLLDQLDSVKKRSGEATFSLAALTKTGVGVYLGSEVVQGAASAARALYQASAAGERLRTTLQFATGNSARDLVYLTELTGRLGLRMEGTSQAYASFAAAARGTAIEGQKTRDIFEAISKASSVMGLTSEQSAGALLALQQMISKGTVQAEELRGQLGERLPGSFQIAAKAMGVTTAELGKMLEQGQVVADDFLPKFAKALDEHIGAAAENAANRLDAATNKVDTAWERLKRNVGDAGASEGMRGQLLILEDGMNSVSESIEKARASGSGFAGQMASGAGAVLSWLNPLNGFNYEVQSTAGKLAAAEQELAKLQKQAQAGINVTVRMGEVNALIAQLRSARGELASLGGAGGGRGFVNPETTVQQAARFANVDSYLGNSARQTKAEQQAAESAKAKIAYEKAYKDAVGDTNRQLKVKAAYETELANIADKYKDKGGAAAAKKEQSAYESLIASIKTKIETNREELEFGGRLTESDKLRIKLLAELDAGSKTLTATHRASALALLETLDAQERQMRSARAAVTLYKEQQDIAAEVRAEEKRLDDQRKAGISTVTDYLKGLEDAEVMLRAEIESIGKSADERQRLIDKYTIELDLKKKLAAINANEGMSAADKAWASTQLTQGSVSLKIDKNAENAAKSLQEFLDPERAQDFGEALRDAFAGASDALGGMSGAINKAMTAIDRYGKRSQQIAKQEQNAATALASGKMKAWEFQDATSRIQAETERNNQQALRDTLGIFGDLTSAASQYFDKQSSGYKTLQTVSAVFHAAQLAMTTAELVPKAISAVLGQGQGEPYSAFARMAAMAAFVASLGVSLGGGGGGGGSGGGYTGIKAGGTGTVLGMEGQQSESIGNAIDILADNSKIELGYTQKMLSELTKVREGIQGLAGTASTDLFIRGMAGGGFGDDFLDSGIGFFPGQSVADIIEKGVQGVGFNLIFQNGAQPMWKALDEEFTTGVGRVLANVAETVYTAADALGLNDAALQERMLSLIPTLGDTSTYMQNGMFGMTGGGLVSLKDMTGEEIQKELEAIFSAVGDQMAAAALPALRPFQQVGEGMFETLIRVTTGIETAEYALEQFGLTAIDYSEIARKNGDIAVEIMRQTIMGAERELAMYRYGSAGTVVSGATPETGLASIIDTFVGDASELQELYAGLLDVRDAMKSVGAQALDLSRDMIRGAGGLEALQSGLDAYLTNFFTEQEQVDAAWARMAEDFDRLGVAMPKTNEQFRALVEGLDTSTAAGANLFGGLMSLADAFADVTGRTDDLAEAARQAEQAERERLEAIAQATKESWKNVLSAFDGISAEFLDDGALRQYRAERIRDQLAESGLNLSVDDILGASKDQFAAAFKHLFELGTDEGRNQAAALAGVWSAFKQLLPVEEEVIDVTKDLEAAFREAVTAADAAYSALERSINAEKARITALYNEQVSAIQAQTSAATKAAQERVSAISEIFSAIDSAIKSTQIESEALSLERRRAAQSVLQGALAYANTGGSLTNYQGLQGALDVFSSPSADLYSTFEEYSREQAAAGLVMSELRERAEAQVSVAELTLEAITLAGEEQLKQLKLQYEADIEALDLTLEYWREQLDAVKGVDNRVKSVADAVTVMGRSISAAIAAQTAMLAAQSGVDGSHAAGLAYVPYDGYRAELHKGETVLNAQQANLYRAGALGGTSSSDPAVQGLLREIASKLHDLEQQANGIRVASQSTADTLDRCDVGGALQTMAPTDIRKGVVPA
ncbi:tape measure protein [Xenophilus sp. Marseille-Q4582]|uniref:tape measure protein n=1 Tax=Xenophilus sp. Marseille-Q4582 TaxID=2866600 RepID=UPI001CE454BF|nr:tape measure protein [Xenophilus sp. Marseille-Q4582]